ncbi:hypothetical protein GDO86_006575 [Hymenochirus boettgeri]|uniref:Protein FAM136A n=1 Tax=Hymenochirus boettgeri TaxID=247094 RepID=A0A8T2J6S3_9PIPI|nr:hypothetical protein GDO86_006575 [Hymenochirus boettgeri]
MVAPSNGRSAKRGCVSPHSHPESAPLHFLPLPVSRGTCRTASAKVRGGARTSRDSCITRNTAIEQTEKKRSAPSLFQDRLSRCTMNCNDKAKDSFDSGSKEAQVKALLDSCVSKCAEEHMNLIPSMTRKMKDALLQADK